MAILQKEVSQLPESSATFRSYKAKKLIFALVVFLAAVWAGRAYLFPSFPKPDNSTWQAVFLTNDQVYFGKLSNETREYAVLDSIFYLRVSEPLQQGATGQPALNLVKLGGELHGPSDRMYIPKDKIMFWENMKSDSQVVQAISNFLKQ